MSGQIVLLAPNGQVGFELKRALAPLGTVHCLSRAEVDFADIRGTLAKIAAFKPQVIVNAAAWTEVDKAETAAVAAYQLNAELPAALAQFAQASDSWLVHYSTDYVYPGDGEEPWQEDSPTGPLSVYGASKLAGDLAIQQHCQKYLIFRTSWVYAARGKNFMKTMLKLAQQRDRLSVVADQFGAPTPARLIANVTALALQQARTSAENKSGLYHLAAAGVTSWYQFAEAILVLATQAKLPLQLHHDNFKPITSAEYPTPARRPANSRLSLSKIEQQFGLTMPDWQQELVHTFEEFYDAQVLSFSDLVAVQRE